LLIVARAATADNGDGEGGGDSGFDGGVCDGGNASDMVGWGAVALESDDGVMVVGIFTGLYTSSSEDLLMATATLRQ
jgi:hypothetical protein